MNDEDDYKEFYHYFTDKNYEKSRRFNEKFIYDPQPLKDFLNVLGNPQWSYKTVHVAGTTGKGSAATYLSRALGRGGRTGLYISPHLDHVSERISLQFQDESLNISTADFLRIWNSIKDIEGVDQISFFDALTAISMIYFKEKKVDWAVFETGLGGKYDSTNNLKPEFCIITPIGLDHQNILGDTIEKITAEKGGIIQSSVPVYAYVKNPAAQNVLSKICEDVDTRIDYFKPNENMDYIEKNYQFISWLYAAYFKMTMPVIQRNLIGRLEVLSRDPLVIFDSAHNELSFYELMAWLKNKSGKWNIYINMMKERNILEIAEFILSENHLNFQVTLYLFPVEEAGYYSENDLIEKTGWNFITTDLLKVTLRDSDCKHLIAGSMRLYPKIKGLLLNSSLP